MGSKQYLARYSPETQFPTRHKPPSWLQLSGPWASPVQRRKELVSKMRGVGKIPSGAVCPASQGSTASVRGAWACTDAKSTPGIPVPKDSGRYLLKRRTNKLESQPHSRNVLSCGCLFRTLAKSVRGRSERLFSPYQGGSCSLRKAEAFSQSTGHLL